MKLCDVRLFRQLIKAHQHRGHLGPGCAALRSQTVAVHAVEQADRDGPAHGVQRVVADLALNRLKARRAEKRGGDGVLSLEELDGCIPDGKRLEESLEARELARSISAFLRTETGEARQMFVLRYFYCEPVEAIAQRLGVGQSKVKSALARTRKRLRQHLEKEGMIHEA